MDQEPMCRACLSESGDAVPIFSSAETSGVQMPLSDMMMACSSVQVMSGDGLPSLICLECLRSLLIAFEFKLKCEKTDAMLREYIENNLVPMQVGTVYNKTMAVDSGTLVPVAQAGNSTEIKQMVSTNELISTIPTIAINNANAIYSNTNPYIIPMVECDVLVKEEQDGMEPKIYHKTSEGGSIMLKQIDPKTNMTNTTVDMTTFSPRLISTDMIQQTPNQITIYGGHEFRDLIRVSEEQGTLVMPKIETIQGVNTMAQCNVLTTNSYTIDQSQCNTIIQNNVINNQVTTANNNFIGTMTLPTNVAFTIKENTNSNGTTTLVASPTVTTTASPTVRKRNVGTNCLSKIKQEDEVQEIQEVHHDASTTTSNVCHQPRYAIKIESTDHHIQHHHQNIEESQQQSTSTSSSSDDHQQPAHKKQKTIHHKKKTVYSNSNVHADNNKTRVINKKNDTKNNNQLQNKQHLEIVDSTGQTATIINSTVTNKTTSGNKESTTQAQVCYIHQPNQGYIR